MAAAFWGFTSVAGQSETRRVDARLQAGLRATLATYQEQLDAAQHDANSLASNRTFELELQQRNLPQIVYALRGTDNVSVEAADGFHYGRIPPHAATRSVDVVTSHGLIGTVTVGVPFDSTLVEILRDRAGLAPADSLGVLFNHQLIASSPTVIGSVDVPVGQTRTTTVGSERYRVLVAPAVADDPRIRFVVLSPQSLIDAANSA